jgi:hypothetical protein
VFKICNPTEGIDLIDLIARNQATVVSKAAIERNDLMPKCNFRLTWTGASKAYATPCEQTTLNYMLTPGTQSLEIDNFLYKQDVPLMGSGTHVPFNPIASIETFKLLGGASNTASVT